MLYRYRSFKEIPAAVKVLLVVDVILLIIAIPIFLI